MKFLIRRTSAYSEDVKPYNSDKVYKGNYFHVDERTVDDIRKIRSLKNATDAAKEEELIRWNSIGTNHRVKNGHIMRDIEQAGWFIEFNTLEELTEFAKDNEIILSEDHGVLKIEIYDDYRE